MPAVEGKIESVGDGARRGVPIPAGLTVRMADGRLMPIVHAPPPEFERLTVVDLVGYTRHDFPVCLSPTPASKEHVPQSKVGGRVMTLTCTSCNNGLGRAVEGEFAPWCLDAWVGTRATGAAVPGRRALPVVYQRDTGGGEFVYLVAGDVDSGFRQMLEHGQFELEFRPPRMPLVRVAALKSAYLAACIALGSVPDSDSAALIRAELRAVRDADSPLDAAAASTAAQNLVVSRSYREPTDEAVVVGRQGDDPLKVWIILAGVFAVEWPFPDVPWTDHPFMVER